MGKHHIYGPSTLDGLSKCVRFQFKLRDDNDTSGDEGTMLHEAYEKGDTTGLDDEQKNAVDQISKYTESLKYIDGTTPNDWEELREQTVYLKGLTHGTADCILICRKRRLVIVMDAKFTRVESTHDMQLRTYGACVVERRLNEFDTVRTVIAAPRLGAPVVREYDASVLLTSTREYIEELYSTVENPFTPATPDEETCGRCRWAGVCPALGKEVAVAARGMGLPMPEVFKIGGDASPRDRAVAQLLKGIFETWCKEVSKNNGEFLSNGGEIPGFRLMTRSTGAKIPKEDTQEAIQLLRELGIPENVILEHCKITLGELAKAVAPILNITQAGAKEELRETLAGIAVEGSCSYPQKTTRQSNENLLSEVTGG
jgi:hypothetical protein